MLEVAVAGYVLVGACEWLEHLNGKDQEDAEERQEDLEELEALDAEAAEVAEEAQTSAQAVDVLEDVAQERIEEEQLEAQEESLLESLWSALQATEATVIDEEECRPPRPRARIRHSALVLARRGANSEDVRVGDMGIGSTPVDV